MAALVRKDLRALAPVWLGTATAMTVLAATNTVRGIGPNGAAVYALGSVALGAIAIGHEFRHGTMTAMLAAPMRRGRILSTKLAVLAVLLAALGALAWTYGGWVSPQSRSVGSDLLRSELWFLLPLLCGFGLAPWFTLLCRSELAGAVFAGAVPALLLLGGNLLALMMYGLVPDGTEPSRVLTWSVVETGLLTMSVVGLAGTVRIFQRLEQGETASSTTWSPAHRQVVGSVARPAARRQRNPYVVLAVKEFRLQAPSVGVALLFTLVWLALSVAGDTVSARIDLDALRGGIGSIYVLVVTVLIGSIASADERGRRVLGLQLLLPLAFWKQWAVKLGVAAGLATVLASGLPLVLATVTDGPLPRLVMWPFYYTSLTPIIGLSLIGLYVSSLTSGGMRAFLVALGVTVAIWVGVPMFAGGGGPSALGLRLSQFLTALEEPETLLAIARALWTWALPLPFVVLAVLLVRFAMDNHRLLDQRGGRVARQVSSIAALLVVIALLNLTVNSLFRAYLVHREHVRTMTSQGAE